MGGEEGRHHSPGPLLQPAIEGLTHTEGFFHIIHINVELSAVWAMLMKHSNVFLGSNKDSYLMLKTRS